MKKLLALALAVIMSISMVACGGGEKEKSTIDQILEQGYITCAISPDFAPSEFKDPNTGEVMGTDVVFAEYIADYISKKYDKPVELKIKEMDFSACQAAVSTNSVNFSLSGYAETEERAQNYNCVGPYATISSDEDTYHGALVKKGLVIEKVEDFAGLKVGVQPASLQYNLLQDQLDVDSLAEVMFIDNLSMAAQMVAEGKIDCLITDSGVGDLQVKNNDKLEMAGFKFEYFAEGNCGLVNLDEVELAQLIEEALLAADKDIDYVQIRQDMRDKAASMGLEVND